MSESEGRFQKKSPPNKPDTKYPQGGQRPPVRQEFGSVAEVLHWIESRPQIWFAADDSKAVARDDVDSDWRGTRTLDDAFSLARFGWREGAENIARVYDTIHVRTKKPAPMWGYDVAGHIPDIPRFIAGDPECMRSRNPYDRRKKDVLRIVVPINYGNSISQQQRASCGAALLDYVMMAAERRIDVEISVVSLSSPNYFVPGDNMYGPNIGIKIKIKAYSEYTNIMNLAFWLMNNAAQRRILFAIKERLDIGAWYRTDDLNRESYGRSVSDPASLQEFISDDEEMIVFPTNTSDPREIVKNKKIYRRAGQ